jgi:hypothetical protein
METSAQRNRKGNQQAECQPPDLDPGKPTDLADERQYCLPASAAFCIRTVIPNRRLSFVDTRSTDPIESCKGETHVHCRAHAREIPVDLFYNLSPDELDRSIATRSGPGAPPIILGHNYQQDGVYNSPTSRRFPDASPAAEQTHAEFIIFCGVHFMAEADLLPAAPDGHPPDMAAGCSMADMADIESVERAWRNRHPRSDEQVTPVTYTTRADLAFCGRHGESSVRPPTPGRSSTGRSHSGRRFSSSPIRTWAGTPRSGWEFQPTE